MPASNRPAAAGLERNRSLWVAAMIGVGVMAAVDEIIFHQVLSWHHFYDRSTLDVALLADGLLHASELILIVAGFFLFADLQRRQVLAPQSAVAGAFLGLGGFQLADGIIVHKVLRLHQIRYEVDLLPYDLTWNLGAAVLLIIGTILAVRSRHEGNRPPERAHDR